MSGGLMLPVSHCESQKVDGIVFEVFKAEQVKRHGVCRVTEPLTFVNGQPVKDGLSDLRMGTTERTFPCETCHMTHPDCPGHFGYIELAEPMFNIGLFDITKLALRCVCKSCSALLDDPTSRPEWDDLKHLTGRARLTAIVKLCGNKQRCQAKADDEVMDAGMLGAEARGCGQVQPKIKRPEENYPTLILHCVENEVQSDWYGEDAYRVLDGITDRDAKIMGFDPARCHPRDLLLTVLPVPPPPVRPTVSFGSQRSDNELTHKLRDIVKYNLKMQAEKQSGVGREAIAETRMVLQEHLATYVNNKSTYYKPSKMANTTLKSIGERLKGKYGRVRGNLMGKRVDFSARTVITGDPNIDVDEVGVPYSVAMTLTFPERVNHANRKRLTEIVRRSTYPSANYIIHANGLVRSLGLMKEADRRNLSLEIGDVVERHMLDRDVILFNRQPTLHRMSMMGHRARVLPFNTFRLNLSCTTPYNADFDGDEMNLHLAQSLLTKAELIEMMMVPKNFVSPGKSQPCMGIVQDSLLGCYRLTQKETFLDKIFMQSMVMWLDKWELPTPAIVKPEPLWTGKQVFTMLLPEVTHTTNDNKPFPDDDTTLLIRRGELLCGHIKKAVVGAAPGSLIHVIANEKGSDEVAKFINFVQRTTAYFLYNTSFSVGVQDTVADADTLAHVARVLKATRADVQRISAKANDGELTRKTGMTLLQSFETDVNNALNKYRESAAQKALSNVKRTNNFKQMIEAGSKGSDLNICQIAVMVGQQNVAGGRIPFGFRRRTLPHFVQDDYGETSRGMVNHGYLDGLTPPEFLFHTMGGREGLIDTAVKTADTGYLQRKLVKALEDAHATYDGTVRNANGGLLQLIYGEDGLEGSKIEQKQPFKIIWYDNKTMRDNFRFEYGDDGSFTDAVGGTYMSHETKRVLRANPETYATLQTEFEQLMHDRDHSRQMMPLNYIDGVKKGAVEICLPVNLDRLVRNAQNLSDSSRSGHSDLNPVHVVDSVRKLQNDMKQFFHSYHRTSHGTIDNEHASSRIESALTLFFIHMRATLSSKRVIKDYKLDKKSLEYLLGEVRLKYLQSLVPAGEMIGPIAAQSCGEPATQMTLNTFHNAGISSKNVTLGVPRLQELLNVSKNQKNSSMLVNLIPAHQTRANCEAAVHRVEYASLETLTRRIEVIYDPDPRNTIVESDRGFVEAEWDDTMLTDDELREREVLLQRMCPWIVRVELDKDLVTDKEISMSYIKQRIEAAAAPEACPYLIEHSRSNEIQRVVRLRLLERHTEAVEMLKETIPELLSRVHLAGIKGVKKVLTKETTAYVVDEETGALQEEKKWCLDTEGTALRRVWGSVRDETGESIVDFTRTASNNIPEVYRVLGIEAARLKFFYEMRAAYNAYGVFINYRHYSVLMDTMCFRGYIMAVNRTGINRSDVGPLMSVSFEETVKILMEAAAFGTKDSCRGVSASLMLGNQVKVGTGTFDLILDTTALKTAVSQEEAVRAGRDVNVYHGLSSVAMQSVVDNEARTPLPQMSVGGSGGMGAKPYGVPSPSGADSAAYSMPIPSPGMQSMAAYQPSELYRGAAGGMRSAGQASASGLASAFVPDSNYAPPSSVGGGEDSVYNLGTPNYGGASVAGGDWASLGGAAGGSFSADYFGAYTSPQPYAAPAAMAPTTTTMPPPAPRSRGMTSAAGASTAAATSQLNSMDFSPGVPETTQPGVYPSTTDQHQYGDRV